MATDVLASFLGWCLALNFALFGLWLILWFLIPETIYRLQTTFFNLTRSTFDVAFYSFLGGYKLLVLFFNLIPYLALKIAGQ